MTTVPLQFEPSADVGVYVIAEVGVNHDGKVGDAHALIETAHQAGADAVKFQTFEPAALVSDLAEAAPYQISQAGAKTQHELLSRYVLPSGAWAELAAHARELGIDFMSTAVDGPSLDLVCGLDVSALKLGSGELTNKPFLQEVATRGLPVICSTGMGDEDEVAHATQWLAAAPGLMLLHCVSSYPAPVEQCNLRAIPAMRNRFQVPVGWSDHTVGLTTSIAAVALGAASLEKHITLDKSRPGPDHAASADPAEFTRYVAAVRETHASLGTGKKEPVPAERENRPLVRRSWHAARQLTAGQVLTPQDVVAIRPASGVPPYVEVVGRRLAHSVNRGAPLREGDLA